MELPNEINSKLERLFTLCNKYKVNKLFVFGSVSKGEFDIETSDIDLIVELENLPPIEKGEVLMKLWSDLEVLFLRKVDLVTNMNMKNPYLKREIEKSKFLLYDRAG